MIYRYINSEGGEIDFDQSQGFVIQKPKGVDSVSISFKESQGVGQTGTVIQSANVAHRVINVKGIFVGEWERQNRKKLLSVVRPDLEGRFYAGEYFVACRPQETPSIQGIPHHAEFVFTLLAPYPYWQRESRTTVMLSGIEPLFRLSSGLDAGGNAIPAWNVAGEYSIGRVMQAQFINVINDGQIPVPFTVRFTALSSVANPRLEHGGNGKSIQINRQMSAGEVVTVELTHTRTNVTSNLSGDIRGALTLRSDLTRLEVGDNILKPSCDSGDLDVEIELAPELVGYTT